MKKVIFLILLCTVFSFSAGNGYRLKIDTCQREDYNCSSYVFNNVKFHEMINEKIFRVYFVNGDLLDLSIGGWIMNVSKEKQR